MKPIWLGGLIVLLVACGVPKVSSPAPTPEAIFISYPVLLSPWGGKISHCASANPSGAIYLVPYQSSGMNIVANQIVLELGDISEKYPSLFLSQVGEEQIVVIVNQDNDISTLSTSELRQMYSGQVSRWRNGLGRPITIWVLPEGDPVRVIFDHLVLPSQRMAPDAFLAPDPSSMLEAVADDAGAIGYLPRSYLSDDEPSLIEKVKPIQFDDSIGESFVQPVVAVTESEPTGLMRELLVCLQDQTN